MASSAPRMGSVEWNARRARLRRGIGALRSAADLYRECFAAIPDPRLLTDAEEADEFAAELARELTEMEPAGEGSNGR